MSGFTKEDLLGAMRCDNAHRYKGVKGDVCTLEKIMQDHKENGKPGLWNNSLPTIGRADQPWFSGVPYTKDGKGATIQETFDVRISSFDERHSAHKIIRNHIKKGNFVLAGGMVSYAMNLRALSMHDRDYDLFVVEKSVELAEINIKQLYDDLRKSGDFKMFLNNNCVTIATVDGSSVTVQIILRMYSSISEILHGFDIGASQVAWDGKDVYFTSMGRVAYEQGINVLNLTKRRGSYEYRLRKYSTRGFATVLPNMRWPDKQEFETMLGANETSKNVNLGSYEIKLPRITMNAYVTSSQSYDSEGWNGKRTCYCNDRNECEECISYVTNFFGCKSVPHFTVERLFHEMVLGTGEEESTSDYGAISYCESQNMHVINFKKLLSEGNDFYFYECPEGNIRDAKFAYDPDVIRRKIADYLKMKIEKGALTPRILYKVIPTLENWKDLVYNEILTIFGLNPSGSLDMSEKMVSVYYIVETALGRANKNRTPEIDNYSPKWKEVDEGTTIINPFKMEVVSESDWYGDWYADEENRISESDMYGIPPSTVTGQNEKTDEKNIVANQLFELLKPKIDEYIRGIVKSEMDKFTRGLLILEIENRVRDLLCNRD
jgi:hypothetical protein